MNRPFLGILTRTERLRTLVAYGDDGRDAQKNTVAQIRADLELEEEHGVDSRSFYENEPLSPSRFIVTYRRTLKRLSRL